jgi:hypothetical protein
VKRGQRTAWYVVRSVRGERAFFSDAVRVRRTTQCVDLVSRILVFVYTADIATMALLPRSTTQASFDLVRDGGSLGIFVKFTKIQPAVSKILLKLDQQTHMRMQRERMQVVCTEFYVHVHEAMRWCNGSRPANMHGVTLVYSRVVMRASTRRPVMLPEAVAIHLKIESDMLMEYVVTLDNGE